jgi:hypothetical protein
LLLACHVQAPSSQTAFACNPLKKKLLHLMVILDIIFIPPHGNINFFFALWQELIFLPHPRRFFLPHGNILSGLAAKPRGNLWHVSLYDCHFSSTCLPCLGSLIPNGYLLAMNAPHGNTRQYIIQPCSPSWEYFIQPCGCASRQYFIGLGAPPHGDILSGLAAAPHGNINVFFTSTL